MVEANDRSLPKCPSDVVAGDLRRRVGRPDCEAKVAQLGFEVIADEDVGRLDIPVDHRPAITATVAGVEVLERACDAGGDPEPLRPPEGRGAAPRFSPCSMSSRLPRRT